MRNRRRLALFLISSCALGAPRLAAAQTFTLEEALRYADEHYPAIEAARAQTAAATADALAAQSVYWPRFDAVWQSNRGTANNVFGPLLPQSALPSISGPVLASPSSQSIWGSLTGALVTWEPFDLGLRKATVAAAGAVVDRSRAAEALSRLDVQVAAGTAFLATVAADRALSAAQADLDRRDTLARAAHTLADNQLRPGAEASRADAERAAAATRVIQAQQARTIARVTFARTLGLPAATADVNPAALLASSPSESVPAPTTTHPAEAVRRAAVETARAQEAVLARTDLPRVYLQSSASARGSGGSADGHFDGGADGLGPDRANWAAGVQIVFPNLFDFGTLRARKASAAATTRAESARLTETELLVAEQRQTARVMVESAQAIAVNTPIQLAAAQQSESQARARYQAGLASITEVVDAQSLLAQAEFQDQLARVEVWRARLAEAVSHGSVTPLFDLLGRRPTGAER